MPQPEKARRRATDSGATERQLAIRGAAELLQTPIIGVSGARRASPQGLAIATRIGGHAARNGFALAAGDARGVDTAAACGALAAGGTVIFVPAEGIGRWRPRAEYRELLTPRNHAIVNEFAPDAAWSTAQAHQRNALISRLARALVVVESGTSGGTWQAGLACLRMGARLLVVRRSGNPVAGNERLIARGGVPVTSPDELMAAIAEARESNE